MRTHHHDNARIKRHYPLYPCLALDKPRQQAELFARLGVPYHGSPDLMQRTLPTAYEADHALFGLTRTGPDSFVLRDVQRAPRGGDAGGRSSGADSTAARRDGSSDQGRSADQGLDALRDAAREVFACRVDQAFSRSANMAGRKETGHAQDAKDRSSEAHSERILDKQGDTDNSDVGPNATETQRATEVQSLVDRIAARWANAPKMVVAENLQDPRIQQAVREQDQAQRSQGASGDLEGFFNDGTVYLLADQLPGDSAVLRVLMHDAQTAPAPTTLPDGREAAPSSVGRNAAPDALLRGGRGQAALNRPTAEQMARAVELGGIPFPKRHTAASLDAEIARAEQAKAVNAPTTLADVKALARPQNEVEPASPSAKTKPKEPFSDPTPSSGQIALDSPLAKGPSTGAIRGAVSDPAGDRPADDRGIRAKRGRAAPANDGQRNLGDMARDSIVPDGTDRALERSVGRLSADFRPGPGGLTRTGSWFDTATRNVDLIELALKIKAEGRKATPEEQAQLARYAGFGASAIRNDLFPVPGQYARKQAPNRLIWPNLVPARWKPLAERIEKLPVEWQRSILQSSQYAHYTSEGIVRGIWSAVQRLGFTGGKVFEPGGGIGSFAMLMPDAVHQTSVYTGIEFDGPTATIAALLSPEQHMLHADFIKRKFPKNFYDVSIGNPPFSQTKIFGDPEYEKHGFMLHDFFFAKSIDLVRREPATRPEQ